MTVSLLKNATVELTASELTLFISGMPGFDSANALADAGTRWLQQVDGHSISVDVTQVKAANSGVLCVLLEWLRAARKRNIEVTRVALPPRLEALVQLSDLDAVLMPGKTAVDA